MWFAFPEGTTSITVQQQEFHPEIKAKVDDGGIRKEISFFRAPDHFAGIILDQPGFRRMLPPEAANPPPDLPDAASLALDNDLVNQLTGQVDTARREAEAARAHLAEVSAERDDLKLKLHEAEVKVADAADHADDAEAQTKAIADLRAENEDLVKTLADVRKELAAATKK